MASRRNVVALLGACAGLLAGAGLLAAQGPRPEAVKFPVHTEAPGAPIFAPPPIPLEQLPPGVSDKVRRVTEGPTLSASGPTETFACQPATYRWMLDHPCQTSSLWRLLGAKVMDLEDRGPGRFGWRDANGSEIQWETVLDAPEMRIWYAEGKVKPGLLFPAIHGRVVVVLRYQQLEDSKGRRFIRHRAHLLLRTDSRTLAVVARMLGGSAPRIAEHCLAQLEVFYGAMGWYLDQDAARAERMFRTIGEVSVPSSGPR